VASQHHHVGLEVVADLENSRILEHSFQAVDRRLAVERASAAKALMSQRHVTRAARRGGEDQAD
jgi:hypothetical protein